MSVESAIAYIRRMRSDDAFRQTMNAFDGDDDASWAYLHTQGFEFSVEDFKKGQEEIYREYGVTPM
jgi:predicted ribosomally synthesized peptide with nif11-like leader